MEHSENLYFSIVLPAYNEAENLPALLRNLKRALDKANLQFEIIVADNGSTDKTEDVLMLLEKEIAGLKTVKIEKNIGFGNGVIQGLKSAQGNILGFMNADGQVKPEELISAYFKLKNDNLDICKGTRIIRNDGFLRKIISKIYNFLFQLMFRCSFQDINGNPKVFTRHFYTTINPESKDWFLDAEILIKAQRNNFLVGEVPVISQKRKKGSSKVCIIVTGFEFLKNMFYYFCFNKK